MKNNYCLYEDNTITFTNKKDKIKLTPIYDGRLSLTTGYPSGFTVAVFNHKKSTLLFEFHLFWEDEWINEESTDYWLKRSEELGNVSIEDRLIIIVLEMIDKIKKSR